MPNLNYAMMNACERNGITGNCGSAHCEVLMNGECETQDEFDHFLLAELGVIEIVSQVKVLKPNKVREQEAEEAYDRAMSIL
jgi:hypothetical protein